MKPWVEAIRTRSEQMPRLHLNFNGVVDTLKCYLVVAIGRMRTSKLKFNPDKTGVLLMALHGLDLGNGVLTVLYLLEIRGS